MPSSPWSSASSQDRWLNMGSHTPPSPFPRPCPQNVAVRWCCEADLATRTGVLHCLLKYVASTCCRIRLTSGRCVEVPSAVQPLPGENMLTRLSLNPPKAPTPNNCADPKTYCWLVGNERMRYPISPYICPLRSFPHSLLTNSKKSPKAAEAWTYGAASEQRGGSAGVHDRGWGGGEGFGSRGARGLGFRVSGLGFTV